jgi:4-hydroxy-3-methylbut-2-enyl diphosphate reductase
MAKLPLHVLLAHPRGFCAGVDRAIQTVENALDKFGAPVYVRHEIVHNRYVVEGLEARGAVFVDELDDVPPNVPLIFSAHGVPKSVLAEAERRRLLYIDATCPLVSKVHREAERHDARGRHILLIGHSGHPEVIGTMGQLTDGAISLIENIEQAEAIAPEDSSNLAYLTQTTLSVDETAKIVQVLKRRFPSIQGPHKQDICYATTNRQHAVQMIAGRCDYVIIIGAPNSSNSLRLVEVAEASGCARAALVNRASDIAWAALEGVAKLGISAGASAPEVLVDEVITSLRTRFDVRIEEVTVAREDVYFRLPQVPEAAL